MSSKKTYENNYVKIWFDGDFMFVLYKSKILDLEIAKSLVETRLLAANGTAYPTYIDVTQVKSINKEAREYFASENGYKLITAASLLVNSSVGKFLGNFFLKINKPPVPVKIFTDKEQALEWLSRFVKEKNRLIAK